MKKINIPSSVKTLRNDLESDKLIKDHHIYQSFNSPQTFVIFHSNFIYSNRLLKPSISKTAEVFHELDSSS